MNALLEQLASALATTGGQPESQAGVAMLIFSRWLRTEAERAASAAAGTDKWITICYEHRHRILNEMADEVTRQRLAAEDALDSPAGG